MREDYLNSDKNSNSKDKEFENILRPKSFNDFFGQDQILKNIPVSRLGLPSDVASACIYLSSDEASFVTGSTLHVNGGMGMF